MKLNTKILIIVGVSAAIAAATASIISKREVELQGSDDLVKKSQAVLDQLEGTRDFVASQGGLDEHISQLSQKFPNGDLPKDLKMNVLKRVPIFSAMKVGEDQSVRSGYKFRVFSNEPRDEANLANKNEMSIFTRFEQDLNLKEIVDKQDDVVIVYRPVRLSEAQGCLLCHGNPSTSPFKNGKDVLGYKMENWVDGKLHGVFSITSDMAATKASSRASVTNILIFSFIGLILSVGLAWLILKKPLGSLVQAIDMLKSSSNQVSTTGHEISNASQSLSTASTRAAAALEQTSASLEELTSIVRLNSENAKKAKEISESATNAAKTGESQMQVLLDSMKGVAASAKKVEEITGLIDDISFQTNLLALNASVEAARAGEQGRGFAVVAEAVRNLANRSAVSAKEISDLIKHSVDQIQDSYDNAIKSEKTLHAIVLESEKVSALNSEISAASEEQSTGIEQIGKAVHELDKVTQNNAASSEETAAASTELSAQSDHLDRLVQTVDDVVYGKRNAV